MSTSTTVTDEQVTMAMIAKAGTRMWETATAMCNYNEFAVSDVRDLCHAIMVDVDGGGYEHTLASVRSYKIVLRSLLALGEYDLRSTVERMANGTPDDAAWTYGFYAAV